MHILFVNGRRLQLTWREMLRMYQHPWSVALMIGALILFASLKPHAVVVPDLPFYKMTLLWANSVVGYYAIYLGISWAAERLGRNLWSIFILLAVSLYQTLGGSTLVVLLGYPPVPNDILLQLVVFHLILLALIEVVFISFIMPRVLGDLRMPPEVPGFMGFADTGMHLRPEPIVLLGKRFNPGDLLHIEAQEHYVQITTTQGRHLLRGRISDIEMQLPKSLGLRVHRSHWVAARTVKGLYKGGACALKLEDGTEVPVARARRDSVLQWVVAMDRPVI